MQNQLNHEDSRFDTVLSSRLNIMETAGIHFEITMKRGHTHAMWFVTAKKFHARGNTRLTIKHHKLIANMAFFA